MQWKIALPLHIEYRTMPMLFYVPALLPVMGKVESEVWLGITANIFLQV